MKKLLLYMSVVMGSAVMLRADVTGSITEWLLEGDAEVVCPKIGSLGRALSILPEKTKNAVLDKCEYVFLGLGETEEGDDASGEAVYPRAWYALLSEKVRPESPGRTEKEKAEEAATFRRSNLKGYRESITNK